MLLQLSQSLPFRNLHIFLTYTVPPPHPPAHNKAHFKKNVVNLDVTSNNEYITRNAKGLRTSWCAHDMNTRFFTHNWNVDAISTAKQRLIFEGNALVKWKEIKRLRGLIKLSANKICLQKSRVSWNRSFVLCRHEWIKCIFSEEQWKVYSHWLNLREEMVK
jgi:hypothetical protein